MPAGNIIITCATCQKVNHTVFLVDVTGYTNGEIWDSIEPFMAKAGWAARVHNSRAVKRYFVCPECLATEIRLAKKLPRFKQDATCPKCGGGKLDTRPK